MEPQKQPAPPPRSSIDVAHDSSEDNSSSNLASGSTLSIRERMAALKQARAHKAPEAHHATLDRNTSGESSSESPTAQKWFDRANKHPEVRFRPSHLDSEPPFFLHRSDSDTSMKDGRFDRPIPIPTSTNLRPPMTQHATNESVDDYRSVIDDLTVENKRLKQKLKKYQSTHAANLENDKRLEVRVHGLSQRKKRELEDMLRKFVSGLDHSTNTSSSYPSNPSKLSRTFDASTSNTSKQPSTSSTSNSRPVDSAYASMSTSGQASSGPQLSNLSRHGMSNKSKAQKVQSFLRDIPEGLQPQYFPTMSEKAKKRLVVRRLEQLFTGKTDTSSIHHSQPKQQQEISNQAATIDMQTSRTQGRGARREGMREAHMLPSMSIARERPRLPLEDSSGFSIDNDSDSREAEDPPALSSEEQRPTRPLDLDPDRAQNPEDNIEYIRHLGLLLDDPEGPISTDDDGWIYLNLLVNMAQLHIINVTPDFVRSALSEVSEKFQLSRDGRKVRWKGGVEGTRFSSESGSSGKHGSPYDSDSMVGDKKRRKLESQSSNEIENSSGSSKFMSVPTKDASGQSGASQSASAFHYKPMFRRAPSSKGDLIVGESDSTTSDSPDYGNNNHLIPRLQQSRSTSTAKKQQEDGPLVFYSGAPFYTDLSTDKNLVAAVSSEDSSKSSKSLESAASASPASFLSPAVTRKRVVLPRTTSGSSLPFRPLKDTVSKDDIRPRVLEQVSKQDESSSEEDDISFSPRWATSDTSQEKKPMHLEASGLGGTRPADHFEINVRTRRTREEEPQVRVSKYSAPASGRLPRKVLHSIAPTALALFSDNDPEASSKGPPLSTQHVRGSSVPQIPKATGITRGNLPIKTEVLSESLQNLPPSQLPPPGHYFELFSSSSAYSSDDEEGYQRPRAPSVSPHVQMVELAGNEDSSEKETSDMDDVNRTSDSSLDMLGRRVKHNKLLDQQVQNRLAGDLPAGSSAATHGGGSGFSSLQTSEDEP